MRSSRLISSLGLLFALIAFSHQALAQTSVRGRVLDSLDKPVGGVDVAIYVPGRKDAVQSMKTKPTTGEYAFEKLSIDGAFDIAYTNSMYEPVFVTRLARDNKQEITKVIYRKGEAQPASALQERFQSARRFSYLAMAIHNDVDRREFVARFEEGIWANLDTPIEKLASDKPSASVVDVLNRDRRSALALRTATSEKR